MLANDNSLRTNTPMTKGDSHIVLKIDTRNPIELSDFVAAFVGIGHQFEQFYDREHPSDRGAIRFYVREVRAGSIIAELVPYLATAGTLLTGAMMAISYANELATFVDTYGAKLKKYFKPGGREASAVKGDLADYLRTVEAIAHDPNATLSLTVFDDGKQRAAFQFDTSEAREAERNLHEHRKELELTTNADHERVLMVFKRTNVAHATTGKRSGDLVQIESINPKPLPIVYASNLAEERIRHEIADADDNVYKKGFDVDVNVEMRDGKPIAYRLVTVHDVIDLPDDD